MKDGEREWLAEHLGHTMDVHKSHYRLQEPVVEMAKLSKLLMAIDAGKSSQFIGKKLSDISVTGTSDPLIFAQDLIFIINATCIAQDRINALCVSYDDIRRQLLRIKNVFNNQNVC